MMNTGTWEGHPSGYTTVEMLLDDVSKQIATSNLTRYSRGTNGQKAGGSMRIAKPSSASNSPRGSVGLGRRRTVMSDGPYRRRLAMLEQQNAMANGGFVSNDGLQIPSRSTRPVSWHPASHLTAQQQYQPMYSATQHDANQFQMFDVPTNQTAYSGYASPSSTFSPLSMPFNGYEQPQYLYQGQTPSSHSTSEYAGQQQHHQFQEQSSHNFVQQTSSNTDPTMYSHFDWNNFATNGFENSSTAPPTPENFLPIQHPEPNFPAEDAIPYHPLSEPESDGEELIGMGLYDAPEVTKTPSSHPELDNYRALMMTGFLGTGYGKVESTGKGLKLEETWNPPPSDDEDEDDDEEDGEAEDDDEPPAKSQPVTTSVPQQQVVQTQMNFAAQGYGGPGWL
ncbi:hypothetical protein ONS95_000625 [Cadophora gregata]|uniref:uncharacterized protein n=1 Tax=Cadophora gregata TaxID=51156 RepID=UPI0026DB61EA|nr:uncharacterized protein ONS95_000625 [Cadophora gregata]KAK0125353.1 hypothetical protein ONS96_009201 [Cadophora gregata f. sp. sojae]KAK0128668.1 hypothetical protein ONS95_000625 [Cadophora gregata]